MILDKRIKSQGASDEEHVFLTYEVNPYGATHPTRGHRYFKIMFLLFDFLMFIAFVQNNCCGTKLKAMSCRYNLQIFLIHRFIHFIVIDNRVKKDLLIIYSKILTGGRLSHSIAMVMS